MATPAKKGGLGRGLGALIPTAPEVSTDAKDSRAHSRSVGSPAQRAARQPHTGTAQAKAAKSSDTPNRPSDLRSSDRNVAGAGHKTTGTGASSVVPAESGKSASKRPVDVFFPDPSDAESERQRESWDAAANSGRLGLKASHGHSSAAAAQQTGRATSSEHTRGTKELAPVPGARFAELPIHSITPNAKQPRAHFLDADLAELVNSVKQVGVLQPIVVRPMAGVPDSYELIMGERRWRASKAAGLDFIPTIIRETDDTEMLREALLENLHRADLNPIEEAAAYRQLLDDFGCTQEQLSAKIARSRPQISNTLRLLKLPPLVQRRVANGAISAGHARALLGLHDQSKIETYAQRVISDGLSVRATEDLVTLANAVKRARVTEPHSADPVAENLATRLSERFGTRVGVHLGNKVGRVTVEFQNAEDLNRILAVMAPGEPRIPAAALTGAAHSPNS